MPGPDIKNVDALPAPILGEETPAPEPDTKNLDALLASLNGSAERFQTLWFSFLGLTLYLAITALATTHRNLLLGEPQTLPILNIKVELLPFYIIAPLLYVVFHFYLLMMLALLARTAAEFDKQLRMTLRNEAERERYRARVENALFLQLLVGMKGERSGANGFLLGLIALITVVLAPLATLILMQMMFLPYHHLRITWWHRGAVAFDVVLVVVMWTLFFKYSGASSPLLPFRFRPRLRLAARVVAAFAFVALASWLSGWEGRWAGEPLIGRGDFAATRGGVVFGLFSDRLILPNEIIVGNERLEEVRKEIASRGIDFDPTRYRGDFVPTRSFDGRDLQAADLSGADLRRASFRDSVMRGAAMEFTRLGGASLERAQLQQADLWGALLPGSHLKQAQLQGAHLILTRLQGAELDGAQLQGALLAGANLRGANLRGAQMQGASLLIDLPPLREWVGPAELQGADLGDAQLQGADLRDARLQGADLGGAQIQGADVSTADLSESEFGGTFVFRTNLGGSDPSVTATTSMHTDAVTMVEREIQPLGPSHIGSWSAAATQFAIELDKVDIAKRFARLKSDFQSADQDARDQQKWGFADSDATGAMHRLRLAAILGNVACDPGEAPYVALGLIRVKFENKSRLTALGDQLAGVRDRMKEGRKSPERCPGVAGFTDADWRRLEAIRPDFEAAPANR